MSDPEAAGDRLFKKIKGYWERLHEWNRTGEDAKLAKATKDFRKELELAARHGFEDIAGWGTLAMGVKDLAERLVLFERGLQALDEQERVSPAETPDTIAGCANSRANVLYEMALIHAAAGRKELARDFLERALPHARLAADIPDEPNDDSFQEGSEELEGLIAVALLRLDGEAEG
jgi:tetratricopeptide (TPR) repeat protein